MGALKWPKDSGRTVAELGGTFGPVRVDPQWSFKNRLQPRRPDYGLVGQETMPNGSDARSSRPLRLPESLQLGHRSRRPMQDVRCSMAIVGMHMGVQWL